MIIAPLLLRIPPSESFSEIRAKINAVIAIIPEARRSAPICSGTAPFKIIASTIEKIILTHNREDVLHLNRLMYLALADVPDIHQALARYGFPAAGGRLSVRPKVKSFAKVLRITGEQITNPIAAAYFPDADEPLTVTFNATSSSFEIIAPLSSHGEDLYMDVSFIDSPILRTDPDCINGYLILNPRTVNLVSGALAEMYLNK